MRRGTEQRGARVLLLGVDGADPDLIAAWTEAGELPCFARLTRGGLSGRAQVFPLVSTLPAWTSVLTGATPGRHGVLDFTRRRGYRVEFVGGAVRRVGTVASHLDAAGLRVASLGFPATYPPEELLHGVVIAGWDSPVASSADRSFVQPAEMHERLLEALGPRVLDFEEPGVDELRPRVAGGHDVFARGLERRARRRASVASWLMKRSRWDLLALYFGETDTAAHHLWPAHDPASPRRPRGFPPVRGHEDPLLQVYRAVDSALAELIEQARPEAVVLVSDHGSGGASDKVLYLNRWLAEAGLQRRSRRLDAHVVARARDQVPGLLPASVRDALFSAFGRALPTLVESRTRFGGIDFGHTVAFSEELPYAPSVWLNVVGREPSGVVPEAQRIEAARHVARRLERELRDPWTGAPVVDRAWLREEVLEGPAVEDAPDLILELALDGGYTYALLPSARGPSGCGPWRRLAHEELLGRKGRAMAGSHRPAALLSVWGAGAGVGHLEGARLEDVTPTVCSLLGVPWPAWSEGRSLVAAGTGRAESSESGDDAPGQPLDRAGAAVLSERLRRLGYLD